MSAKNDPTSRSIEELVDVARAQAGEDASSGGHRTLGATVWSPSSQATDAMLGLADHSATLDEPGKYGAARVASERAAATVERGLGTIRASIAEVYGSSRRLLTLRHAVGHNWHRRIQVEHGAVLSALILMAVGAETVFAATAAKAVGLYDQWQQLLFGAGAAIAYLGVGAFIGRSLVPESEIRPDEDPDAIGSHRDPVIKGRRPRTSAGTMMLVAAFGVWLAGTTGLTILRESNARQEQAIMQANRAQDRRSFGGGPSANPALATTDAESPLRDGIAMWCIAAMIGAGLTFLEATRSDPVVREWHDTTRVLERSVQRLEARSASLMGVDIDRRDQLEALRNHHDGLAHRAQAHQHLATAQAIAYTQRATAEPEPGTNAPTGSVGHDKEIDHHVNPASSLADQIADAETHLALAVALAATAQGIVPEQGDPFEQDISSRLHAWITRRTTAAPAELPLPAEPTAPHDASTRGPARANGSAAPSLNGSGHASNPVDAT